MPLAPWLLSELRTVFLPRGVPIDFHEDSRLTASQDQNEKFLAYLPHSGFHNQRIAFENALVLARLLNRTLLVPPVYLGNKPIRYVHFDTLYQDLVLSSKIGLQHCSRITSHGFLPLECMDYFTYTQISWDWLVDLRRVKNNQRLRQRWNMTEAWMCQHLNISTADIHFIKDSTPYQYRFLDSQTDVSPSSHKFLESVYILDLMMSTKRLIHIGTLFGSSRLRLKDPTNIAIRGAVRESMSFSNPSLLDAAKSIANTLGPFYLGLHLRLGDGHFKRDAEYNARRIWWRLVHDILDYTEEETVLLEHAFMGRAPALARPSDPFHSDNEQRFTDIRTWGDSSHSLRCQGRLHANPHLLRLNTPIFMSTDAEESNPLFSGFRRAFPCVFYLSDFPAAAAHLDELYNAVDGVKMRQFMLPFLDALVVGHAGKVVGTENSTFSHFVQDVLWRKFHGLAVVQRG